MKCDVKKSKYWYHVTCSQFANQTLTGWRNGGIRGRGGQTEDRAREGERLVDWLVDLLAWHSHNCKYHKIVGSFCATRMLARFVYWHSLAKVLAIIIVSLFFIHVLIELIFEKYDRHGQIKGSIFKSHISVERPSEKYTQPSGVLMATRSSVKVVLLLLQQITMLVECGMVAYYWNH